MSGSSNFLARFFDWNREVVEAAETPFAKLAVFILPILAPLVPAFMTTLHLQKLLSELFTFTYSYEISWGMSILTGVVLELLGYVGAIAFIRSIFDYVKNKDNDARFLPIILNGFAYVFYVIAMWLINFQLGKYFGTPNIVNSIFGLLSFITIPTGLLAANHLSQASDEEREDRLRHEKQEYNLKRYAIKKGVPLGSGPATQTTKDKKHKAASAYKEKMLVALNDAFDNDGRVMTPIELSRMFNLDYDRSKGFISGLRITWARSRGIDLTKKKN